MTSRFVFLFRLGLVVLGSFLLISSVLYVATNHKKPPISSSALAALDKSWWKDFRSANGLNVGNEYLKPLETDTYAYRTEWGITLTDKEYAELLTRKQLTTEKAPALAEYARQYPSQMAGTYFDRQSGSVTINITNSLTRQQLIALRVAWPIRDRLNIRYVTYSEKQLDDAVQQVRSSLASLQAVGISIVGITKDYQLNGLRLATTSKLDDAKQRAVRARTSVPLVFTEGKAYRALSAVDASASEKLPGFGETVRFHSYPALPLPQDTDLGRKFDIKPQPASAISGAPKVSGLTDKGACSVGYYGAFPDFYGPGRERFYMVTAGHCADDGQILAHWYSEKADKSELQFGTVHSLGAPGSGTDAAVVAIDSDWHNYRLALGQLPVDSAQRRVNAHDIKSVSPDFVPTQTVVCMDGATSGRRCGTVTASRADVTIVKNGQSMRFVDQGIISSTKACDGDSGAPVFSGSELIGIVIAAATQAGNSCSDNSDVVFTYVSNIERNLLGGKGSVVLSNGARQKEFEHKIDLTSAVVNTAKKVFAPKQSSGMGDIEAYCNSNTYGFAEKGDTPVKLRVRYARVSDGTDFTYVDTVADKVGATASGPHPGKFYTIPTPAVVRQSSESLYAEIYDLSDNEKIAAAGVQPGVGVEPGPCAQPSSSNAPSSSTAAAPAPSPNASSPAPSSTWSRAAEIESYCTSNTYGFAQNGPSPIQVRIRFVRSSDGTTFSSYDVMANGQDGATKSGPHPGYMFGMPTPNDVRVSTEGLYVEVYDLAANLLLASDAVRQSPGQPGGPCVQSHGSDGPSYSAFGSVESYCTSNTYGFADNGASPVSVRVKFVKISDGTIIGTYDLIASGDGADMTGPHNGHMYGMPTPDAVVSNTAALRAVVYQLDENGGEVRELASDVVRAAPGQPGSACASPGNSPGASNPQPETPGAVSVCACPGLPNMIQCATCTKSSATPTGDVPRGKFSLRSSQYGRDNIRRCLDVAGASRDDGANLQLWDCTGQPNQLFTIEQVNGKPQGVVWVRSVNSDKCVSVTGDGNFDGAPIQQEPCSNDAKTMWELNISVDGVSKKFKSLATGRFMNAMWYSRTDTVWDPNGDNGARIAQEQNGPFLSQDWETMTVESDRDAEFVSQEVPATVAVGQQFAANITLKNTGKLTWKNSDLYALGSQSPENNGTWGIGRIKLPNDVVSGQTASLTLSLTAPSSPGEYDFSWRMVQDGVEWFGNSNPATKVKVVAVGSTPPATPTTASQQTVGGSGASFVSYDAPTSLYPGQSSTVTVVMKNTGTSTWTVAGRFRLGMAKGDQDWKTQTPEGNRVYLNYDVKPNENAVYSAVITAPDQPGEYPLQWRMVQDGVQWFGEVSSEKTIKVTTGTSGFVNPRSLPSAFKAALSRSQVSGVQCSTAWCSSATPSVATPTTVGQAIGTKCLTLWCNTSTTVTTTVPASRSGLGNILCSVWGGCSRTTTLQQIIDKAITLQTMQPGSDGRARCMEIPTGDMSEGVETRLGDCASVDKQQFAIETLNAESSSFVLRPLSSPMLCLSQSAFTNVTQESCNKNDTKQQWNFELVHGKSDVVRIRNVQTEMYLSVSWLNNKPNGDYGSFVELAKPWYVAHQEWKINRVR